MQLAVINLLVISHTIPIHSVCLQEEIDEDCAVAMLWPEVFQSEDTEKNIKLGIKENFYRAKEDDVKEENTNENKVDETGLTQVR